MGVNWSLSPEALSGIAPKVISAWLHFSSQKTMSLLLYNIFIIQSDCQEVLWSSCHFPFYLLTITTHSSWLKPQCVSQRWGGEKHFLFLKITTLFVQHGSLVDVITLVPDLGFRKRYPSVQANPKSALHALSVTPLLRVSLRARVRVVCMSGRSLIVHRFILFNSHALESLQPSPTPYEDPFCLKCFLLSFLSACLCWCPPGRNILQGMYRYTLDKRDSQMLTIVAKISHRPGHRTCWLSVKHC